jgi:hypothetical protein
VNEWTLNESKKEQDIPVMPKPEQVETEMSNSATVQPEPIKPEQEKSEQGEPETSNSITVQPEPIKPEQEKSEPVKPETLLSSANDAFAQAAMNQNSVPTLNDFGAVTPNTSVSELPRTNGITSVEPLAEVKPIEESQPTETETTNPAEKNEEISVIPKESEPFVSDSIPVTPSPVNPLRQETPLPTVDVVQNQPEWPTINVAKNQQEPPTKEVIKTMDKPLELKVEPFDAKQPFNPVAVNGELFVGWEKPKLLLVFTGFLNGYVEPCGCAGLEQMKGGLSRRYTFFKELEEKKGWSILPIDAGNLNKGFGRQEELKFNFVIDESLRLMKYQAAGIGNRELLLPTDALILYFVDVPGIPRRYTSANVAIMEFDPDFTAPYRIFEQNGVKVGVTSVIGQSLLKQVNNDDIKHEDAVKRLKEILPQFAAKKCNKRVLIIHGSAEETKQIIRSVTGQFDYIIPSDTPAEPPFRPNWMENSMLIEVGEKGKFAVAIGLYDDPNTPFRYQRVPLDSRFENSKTITALMQLYQEQLKETGLHGLGIKPIPNRRAIESGRFMGSKSCADCHELSFQVWQKSRHATAWRSLTETSKPSRTFDPECIACHVVGWNPAELLPYEHGFLGEKETPELINVGCETCHGPGENHIKAETGSDAAFQEKHRNIIRLPLNSAKKVCIQCHDGDNSPYFDFETYWQKIVHKEQ